MLSLKHRMIAIAAALLVATAFGCNGDDESDQADTTAEVDEQQDVDEDQEAADESQKAKEDSEPQDDEPSEVADASDDAESSNEGDDEDTTGDESTEKDDGSAEPQDDSEVDDEAAELDLEAAPDIESALTEAPDTGNLPVYATGTVAVVDGVEISKEEFNAVAQQQLGALPPDAIEAQGIQMSQVKDMLVDGLVSSVLIEHAIEERGIEITDAEVDEAIDEFEAMMNQAGEGQSLDAMLAAQGIDDQMLREQVEQELAAERLLEERGTGAVSDDQVRQYYEQNQEQFQQEEMARARHILLNVDDHGDESNEDEVRSKADELTSTLQQNPERFAELAREHSDCPSADRGGDLGYFDRDQLMPEFTEAAFGMEAGELSEPVRSNLGWHVILVEDRQEAGSASFEEVKDDLRMMLEAQNVEQTAMQLIEELQEEADVQIHDENIVVDG